MSPDHRSSRAPSCLVLIAGLFAAVVVTATLYRPDRPLAAIEPGSSAGPAFVVQVIRPRAGLPLGGLLPPGLFGLDEGIGFDSTSAGAVIGHVGPRRIELAADRWELALVLDDDGRVAPETEAVFALVFEEQPRRVRCRPADPVVGTFEMAALPDGGGLAGRFDIELARCADADTGEPLGWPPQPFVLHGSFDRLVLERP